MQPIERYGLVALVFLGITITAACLWEPEGDPAGTDPAAAELARKGSAANAAARPEPRDYVGARTKDAPRTQPKALSAAQRQELLALQGRGTPPSTGSAPTAAGRAMLGDALGQAQEPRVLPSRTDLQTPREEPAHAQPRPAQPPASSPRIYEIQGDDTLSEIAMRELGTWKRWQEIVDLNPGLDPSHLRKGARIKLPAGKSVASSSAVQRKADPDDANGRGGAAAGPAAKGPVHVVQEDESLWKIAAARLGKGELWTEIAALNPSVDPDKLKVGMKLVLPASAARTQAAAPAARTVAQAPASERPTTGKVR